jgi:hypothetical protein
MKQRLPLITAFLLLGAIVNVAVAWTCAYRVRFGPFEARQFELESGQYWSVLNWRAFGSRRIVSVRPVPDSIDIELAGDRRPTFPAWSGIREGVPAPGSTLVLEAAEARGWPLVSLSASFATALPQPSFRAADSPDEVRIAPAVDVANVYDASARTLPLRPHWRGFVANTLLYAAAAWLLFHSPRGLRRLVRRRRGLCPTCGYPPGESAVCTECGAPVAPAPAAGGHGGVR